MKSKSFRLFIMKVLDFKSNIRTYMYYTLYNKELKKLGLGVTFIGKHLFI